MEKPFDKIGFKTITAPVYLVAYALGVKNTTIHYACKIFFIKTLENRLRMRI